ncbi:hypothetical protein JB92DRAFT_3139934 [Gautieria morchelliformis]|nr:hypothetical protein JB92DRAFT_3139934 [Gautieria morchelliformis]
MPVQQIYVWDFHPSNSVDAPFSVMERPYGEDQCSAWPKLTSEEKIKFVRSLADALGRIFKISMPSIGSLEKLTNENHPIVGPYATIDENVMVNDGIVSGIIDWEYHAALPACLAAVYLEFMRFDGIFDPKYNIEKRIMPTKKSWATASEAGPLRSAFREAAGRVSMDYMRSLDLGKDLRRLLEFAQRDLNACHSWERDFTESLTV